uniref:SFRICE040179.2 n=1 Tax=Spodoptera frugiperda TaxID=7108 RepID=A0A2H1X2F5_SPOFR
MAVLGSHLRQHSRLEARLHQRSDRVWEGIDQRSVYT